MITPNNTEIEDINQLTALPDQSELYLPDGRVVKITLWRPTVKVDEAITVEIEGFLEFGDK